MHELAAIQDMVKVTLAKAAEANARRVVGMHFCINEGGHVSEESVRVCFDIAAQDTPAAGAQLHFQWNPPHYHCFHCGHEFEGVHGDEADLPCPQCNEPAMMVFPTQEFYLDSIDVE